MKINDKVYLVYSCNLCGDYDNYTEEQFFAGLPETRPKEYFIAKIYAHIKEENGDGHKTSSNS